MFELLFKYPLDAFERGILVLAWPWWQFILLPLALLVPVYLVLGYFKLRARSGLADRVLIALLRSLALSLLVFSLMRPMLEVTTSVPQPNLVAVLVDNSLSMSITDFAGAPRSAFIEQQLDPQNGRLISALRDKFDTRLYQFGAHSAALNDMKTLNFAEGESDLATALEQVQGSLKGEPLSALVVISDGAVPGHQALEDRLLALRAAGLPIFAVGLGQAQYQRDIEITSLSLPKRVMQDSRLIADVAIRQRGYDDREVELVIEDDSRILHKQQIRLKPGMQSLKIPLDASEVGPRALKFYLANQPDEQITANNSRQAMLTVDGDKMRVLYFEGEPRFEMKFIRRALAQDKTVQLSGLVRTADAKFYRVGITSEQELRDGFPITRDELFSYQAIILGSVEISLLSREQQQMLADFVSQRGGGLLLLGGRHAYTEGGYRESLLHDLAPVILNDFAQPDFTREVKIQPSQAGLVHPALMIAENNENSIARWLSLPALTMVNPIQQVKPGASLLLSGIAVGEDEPYVAMAAQRYGRGKVIAFPVQNSWLWQMHQDIELEDQTHEILWRHLLRWLVDAVPQRLNLSLSSDLIQTDGVIQLRAEVLEADYQASNQANVRAVLTAPDGSEQRRPLVRDPALAGNYSAEITVAEAGDYQVRLELDDQEQVLSGGEARVKVTRAGAEYYQSEMNETLLRRLAEDTGGKFFTPADVDRLPELLSRQQIGSTLRVSYDLWDMPLLFLLLVLALAGEWGYRRWRALS